MAGAYTSRLVPESFSLSSNSIADGNYDFILSNDSDPRPNNVVEYFYFINASGQPVAATAGTVTILASSDDGVTFQSLVNNSFEASAALTEDRTKPSGRGRATHIRIKLSGVTASGATGFKSLLTQES